MSGWIQATVQQNTLTMISWDSVIPVQYATPEAVISLIRANLDRMLFLRDLILYFWLSEWLLTLSSSPKILPGSTWASMTSHLSAMTYSNFRPWKWSIYTGTKSADLPISRNCSSCQISTAWLCMGILLRIIPTTGTYKFVTIMCRNDELS